MSIVAFSSGWSLPVILGGAFLLFYSVGLLVYRLIFHPLARFPGPKLAAASKWYEFYFDVLKGYGGQFAWEIERMHQVYGPIVRINHDELHVADPDWYDTLYARNPTHRDKWPPNAKMAGPGLDTFGTVDHNLYRKRRAANSPFFSKRAIMAAETLIGEQVEQLCDVLREFHADGDVAELRVTFLAFSTDTAFRYVFNQSMGLQNEKAKAQQWCDTMHAITGLTPIAKQFPWITQLPEKLPVSALEKLSPLVGTVARFRQDIHEKASCFLADQISSAEAELAPKSKSSQSGTLFQAIYNSSLPPAEKSVVRMASEACAVVVAASETMSRTMASSMYYLLTNVKALERLDEELLTVMPDAKVMPSIRSLETLPWLTAVVKESLRLSAIVTSRSPLVAPGELRFRDWIIPPKTPVSMTMRDVLHDSRIFPSPLEFMPERWLEASASKSESLDRYFVAFGKGTRNCQGMDFAYVELYLSLATILRRFKFQLYDTNFERDVKVVRDNFLGEPHPKSKGVRVKIVSEVQ